MPTGKRLCTIEISTLLAPWIDKIQLRLVRTSDCESVGEQSFCLSTSRISTDCNYQRVLEEFVNKESHTAVFSTIMLWRAGRSKDEVQFQFWGLSESRKEFVAFSSAFRRVSDKTYSGGAEFLAMGERKFLKVCEAAQKVDMSREATMVAITNVGCESSNTKPMMLTVPSAMGWCVT